MYICNMYYVYEVQLYCEGKREEETNNYDYKVKMAIIMHLFLVKTVHGLPYLFSDFYKYNFLSLFYTFFEVRMTYNKLHVVKHLILHVY